MAFGVYVHIPYCQQICPYCDFTKYEIGKTLAPDRYIELLCAEIQTHGASLTPQPLDTLYFGGGTPSLLEPSDILTVIQALANAGFPLRSSAEMSIEIDPGTLDEKKLDGFVSIGCNRFSVGAQTFDDRLLKVAGRQHRSEDTIALLSALQARDLNYSFDLLFSLPSQSRLDLKRDLERALAFSPSHMSAYCLTVPERNPLSRGRVSSDEQAEMYFLIEETLATVNLLRYEISNYARPGRESKHNLLYWTDQHYWGIGVSAHSYLPIGPFGTRFWNAGSMVEYVKQTQSQDSKRLFPWRLPSQQVETLAEHQALTDFCHTSLRRDDGILEDALRLKFAPAAADEVLRRVRSRQLIGLIEPHLRGWKLTRQGRVLADRVFLELTFLATDALIG